MQLVMGDAAMRAVIARLDGCAGVSALIGNTTNLSSNEDTLHWSYHKKIVGWKSFNAISPQN